MVRICLYVYVYVALPMIVGACSMAICMAALFMSIIITKRVKLRSPEELHTRFSGSVSSKASALSGGYPHELQL